jgi:hypothetical protein
VKCDRSQPKCGWCTRNSHPCEYKERKKPGLRAGYGKELESRLDRLEALLDQQGRELADHLASACTMTAGTQATGHQASVDFASYEKVHPHAAFDAPGMNLPSNGRHQTDDPHLHARNRSISYQAVSERPTIQPTYGGASVHSQALTSPSVAGYPDQPAALPPYDLLV